MTRFSFLAAPLLVLGYGIVRLIDGIDGSHGPGPAWTIGHLLFLVALLLFAVTLVGLRAAVSQGRGRVLSTTAVAVGTVGLLAFIRGIVIDLLAGFNSVDRAAMEPKYLRYDAFPFGLSQSASDLIATLGPVLFGTGLLILLVQLTWARPRLLSWWSPVAAVLGFALISVNLDLLPLGGLSFLVALAPMSRRLGVGRTQLTAASTSSSA